jgi:hypothetical protein
MLIKQSTNEETSETTACRPLIAYRITQIHLEIPVGLNVFLCSKGNVHHVVQNDCYLFYFIFDFLPVLL